MLKTKIYFNNNNLEEIEKVISNILKIGLKVFWTFNPYNIKEIYIVFANKQYYNHRCFYFWSNLIERIYIVDSGGDYIYSPQYMFI